MHKISALLAKWPLSLFAHSCNYFLVTRPIVSRYVIVIKKYSVMTFSDFMITAIKMSVHGVGDDCQKGKLISNELEFNFKRKVEGKLTFPYTIYFIQQKYTVRYCSAC